MAFNKAAEQSGASRWKSGRSSVDGNIVTYSTGSDWWRVDLGREEDVSAVYIIGFSGGSSFDVRVGRLHLAF